MSYEIEVSIHNCGLRLPSPSPAHSPATSARLSARSSISSRSALSHRSSSTVKSDRLQTNTGLCLFEVFQYMIYNIYLIFVSFYQYREVKKRNSKFHLLIIYILAIKLKLSRNRSAHWTALSTKLGDFSPLECLDWLSALDSLKLVKKERPWQTLNPRLFFYFI